MKIRFINARDVGIGKDIFTSKDGKRFTRRTTTKKGYGRGPFKDAVQLPNGLYRWLRRKK